MRVREMTAADIDDVSALRVRSWQSAYDGLMPRSYLAAMSTEEDAAARRELFARADGTITNLVAERPDGTITGWAALGRTAPKDRTARASRTTAPSCTPSTHCPNSSAQASAAP